MKKTLLVLICAILVVLLGSCDPSALQRSGKFLSKTNTTMFGSETSAEKIENVAKLTTLLGSGTSTTELTGSQTPVNSNTVIIKEIQSMKGSESQLKQLREELKKPVPVTETVFTNTKNYFISSEAVFTLCVNMVDVAQGAEQKISQLATALNGKTTTAEFCTAVEGFLGNGIDLDPIIASSGITQDQLIAMSNRFVAMSETATSVISILDPIKDLFTDLNNAAAAMVEEIPTGTAPTSIKGTALVMGSVQEKVIEDLFSCVVAIASSNTDAIVKCAGDIVNDLSTFTLINPSIKFTSLETLLGSFMEIKEMLP